MKKVVNKTYFYLLFIVFLTFLGCPPDAVAPENKAPEIIALTASATTVEAKTKITLTCDAKDPEGDSLNYRWEVSVGTLSTTTGSNVEWTAPAVAGTALITVYVTDGKKSVSKTKILDIVEPNGPVTNFTATVGNTKIFLSWVNPSTSQFAGVKILRKTDAYSINATDGTKVYSGTGNFYEDTGLTNGTKYYYTAYSFNTKGEFATDVTASGIPDAAALDTVATPTFNSTGGSIDNTFSLTISCVTTGVAIYYTKDGSAPSKSNGILYSGSISINDNVTIKAIAIKSGYNDSSVSEVSFTWNGLVKTAVTVPQFSKSSGAVSVNDKVSISCATTGATIIYTVDGTDPRTSATKITSTTSPVDVTITKTTIIKAYATKNDPNNFIDSDVVTGEYQIVVAKPTFSPIPTIPPSIVSVNSTVSITCATTGAEVFYTTDGSDPKTSITRKSSTTFPIQLTITTTTILRAYATLTGYTDSLEATGEYKISYGTVATPVISPTPSTSTYSYDTTVDVTITCATDGATIKYTIDSVDNPSETVGIVYTGKISLVKNATIKAIALKTDYTDSAIATQSYLIDISPKINVLYGGVTKIDNSTGIYEFPETAVNGTNEATFVIKNDGGSNLTLTGTSPNYVTISGTNASLFSVSLQPDKNIILPKTTTTFKLAFTPTAIGSYSATITILNNDKAFTFTIKGKCSYVRLKNWTLAKANPFSSMSLYGGLKAEVIGDQITAVNLESLHSTDALTWQKYSGFLPVYNGATESYSFTDHSLINFNGNLWCIGGMYTFKDPTTVYTGYNINKVYKSTTYGETWVEISPTDGYIFSPINQHTATVFNNKIYIIGGFANMNHGAGYDVTYAETNEVWYSSDCKTWTKEASTIPFESRANHQTVAFNNKLWLIGGEKRSGWNSLDFTFSDIWYSSDGSTWIRSTDTADFGKVTGHKCFVYDNKLWLFNNKWIWYSEDGETWKLMTSSPAFGEISGYNIVQFNNKVYLIDTNNIWVSE
ncbi:MAG: hypothetical protein A2Y34_16720 [Spirochaetes bacterium GWC1_27_15]|nr:MAG: hypothetical protein A2Z98_12235 [Spirochaetes bacterium GWB1_27_13]OHD20967.1 MAG: hypothetical protein A2Y34_16720 [Spirochaetes bacterium GWC1_27_15]